MIEAGLKWGLLLSVCAALTGCIEASEFQEPVENDAQTSDAVGPVDGSTDGTAPTDGSDQDAGTTDAGTTDAGPTDAGTTDTGTTDAGPTDTGTTDTGTTDTGTTDTGTTDTGTTDTGTTDTGTADTGTADTGTADTGTEDVGSNQPPQFTEPTSAPFTTEGQELSYQLEATDAEDDSLNWTLVDGPPGLEIDYGTGVLTWTPGYDVVTTLGGSALYIVNFTIGDEAIPPNAVPVETEIVVYCDADEDGTMDDLDPCNQVPNQSSSDLDNDGIPDDCDDDIDGDGVDNNEDVCGDVPDPDQEDMDEDGEGDACDADMDGDEILNEDDEDVDGDEVLNDDDNCPETPNPGDEDGDQDDLDEDGTGDACDSDLDGDGLDNDVDEDMDDDEVPNDADNCPWDWNTSQDDWDEDGEGDECDDDIDGDGLSNDDDWCPEDDTGNEDTDGDSVADCYDEDDDDDGYNDEADPCPLHVSADEDLMYDVLNCGACGDPCDSSDGANVAQWGCDDGQCVIEACQDGFVEVEGCQEKPVIYVDAFGQGAGTGTEDDPYQTIAQALDGASGGTVVSVSAGIYIGNLSIGSDDIIIEGVGPGTVIKSSDDADPAIKITGDGVALKSLKVVGGSVGVQLKGSSFSTLTGALVENVVIENTVGPGGPTAPLVAGLMVISSTDVMINGVLVSGVSQQEHVNGGQGGESIGAFFDSVSDSTVIGLHVESVIGAQGIGSDDPGASPLNNPGYGGADANGVRINGSSSVHFVDTMVSEVVGGKGGNGWKWGNGGLPGLGCGVLVAQSENISISEAVVVQVWGGEGGYPGAGGGAEPAAGQIGAGFRVTASTAVHVSDFEVLEVTGGKSSILGQGWANGQGVSGTGIGIEVVQGATEVTFERGLIASLKGGPSALYYYPAGGSKGARLFFAGDVILKNLAMVNLSSGDQIDTSPQLSNFGIEIDYSGPVSINHLSLAKVNGTADSPTEGSVGVSLGASQTKSVSIANSILSDIAGPCIQGPSTAIEGSAIAAYAIFDECEIDPSTTGVTLVNPESGSPAFKNVSENDLRLKSTSVAIDAGKPGDDYCEEPEPNGCMVNVGAFGNTDQAQSFGPVHCPCGD